VAHAIIPHNHPTAPLKINQQSLATAHQLSSNTVRSGEESEVGVVGDGILSSAVAPYTVFSKVRPASDMLVCLKLFVVRVAGGDNIIRIQVHMPLLLHQRDLISLISSPVVSCLGQRYTIPLTFVGST
jgi:hypothetical protein